MDYVPVEKPVVIAQANERLIAEYHKSHPKLIDTGIIDQMPYPGTWSEMTTWSQNLHLKSLKPGEKISLLKPSTALGPVIYTEQHKPCSQKTYENFARIVKADKSGDLTDGEVASLSEMLGVRATDKSFRIQAGVVDLGGRKGINLFFGRPSEHKVGRAFFVVSDPKNRLIQEVGYEGAKPGSDPWRKEAEDMLNNIQFVKSDKP
jgi:hypothetical protein